MCWGGEKVCTAGKQAPTFKSRSKSQWFEAGHTKRLVLFYIYVFQRNYKNKCTFVAQPKQRNLWSMCFCRSAVNVKTANMLKVTFLKKIPQNMYWRINKVCFVLICCEFDSHIVRLDASNCCSFGSKYKHIALVLLAVIIN